MAEIETKSERRPRVSAAPIIGAIVVVGFFWTVVYILGWIGRTNGGSTHLPREIIALVGTVIGYVSAKADQVVGYYFGSSAGSAAKTEILERVAQEHAATAAGARVPVALGALPVPTPEAELLGVVPAATDDTPSGTAVVDDPDGPGPQ